MRRWATIAGAAVLAFELGACGAHGPGDTRGAQGRGTLPGPAQVTAVGAESQFANLVSQVGGRYVKVSSVINNPNTDPHEFEASASVAREVSGAQLIVQNGAGYDSFMNTIEQADHNPDRRVVVAQHVLGLPAGTQNPHLWYKPSTMPSVGAVVAKDLASFQPSHRAYFEANLARFDRAVQNWQHQLAAFRAAHRGVPVAVTEPVADYMLQAAGAHVLTPTSLQLAIMNGTDPSPQDISRQDTLISSGKAKVFLYNEQVTDSLTQSFLSLAKKHRVPVVAVYETMPLPGYDYQTWMVAELHALTLAVVDHRSTVKL